MGEGMGRTVVTLAWVSAICFLSAVLFAATVGRGQSPFVAEQSDSVRQEAG